MVVRSAKAVPVVMPVAAAWPAAVARAARAEDRLTSVAWAISQMSKAESPQSR
jgi:hypothetical protein